MSNRVEAVNFGRGIVGVVKYDLDPQDPRADDNIAVFACWHKRYNLGDSGEGGWGKGRRDLNFDEKEFKEKLLDNCGFSTDVVSEDDFFDETGTFDKDAHEKAWNERADELIDKHCGVQGHTRPIHFVKGINLFISIIYI